MKKLVRHKHSADDVKMSIAFMAMRRIGGSGAHDAHGTARFIDSQPADGTYLTRARSTGVPTGMQAFAEQDRGEVFIARHKQSAAAGIRPRDGAARHNDGTGQCVHQRGGR